MDIKQLDFILNDALNKALISKDRIKHPNSNNVADFVSKYIAEINQALQLQQTGVIASCSNTYIGKEFVYTSRITNCKTIFKVARTDDRYGQTILISENKNRYFLIDVIPHN